MRLIQLSCALFKNYCTKLGADVSSGSLKTLKTGDKASVTRTITKEDILNFAKLTGDYNPIHINSSQNIVHGVLLNGLVSCVLGTQLPGPGTILVEQRLKFPNPCYAEDEVEVNVELTSVRKLITCKFTCIANGDKVVLEGDAKLIQKAMSTTETI